MDRLPRSSFAWLNNLFAAIAVWSYRHRWWVLLMSCLILAMSGYYASSARMDNSFDAFFDESDPAYSAYNTYRENFGSDEIIYLMYDASGYPQGVFNKTLIEKIDRLGTEIDTRVPFVKRVRSLTNAELMVADGDDLIIKKINDSLPADQDTLNEFAEAFSRKPLYVNSLFDEARQRGVMIVEMSLSSTDTIDTIRLDPEKGDALENLYPQVSTAALNQILQEPDYAGMAFHVSGDVPLNTAYNRIIDYESKLLGGVSLTIIAVLLLVFFRGRLVGVLGPISVVALSIMMTVAFMSAMDWPMDMMFGLVPSLLISIGVADAVHVVSEYVRQFRQHHDREQALRETLFRVGTPCLLTTITTAIGFLCMSIAPIKSISHLAIYVALGVVAAFFLSITLLTFFLSFARKPKPVQKLKRQRDYMGSLLVWCGQIALNRPGLCMSVFLLLVLAAAVGLKELKVDSNFLSDFSKDIKVRADTEIIDNTMGGMNSYVYLFDTGEEGGLKSPQALRELERVQDKVLEYSPFVRKATSIVDLIKDINQSFHNDDPAYYRIPDNRELISQYLLVYELSGGEELYANVTRDFSRAAMQIRTQLTDSSKLAEFEAEIQQYLMANPLQYSEKSITGMGALYLTLMNYISSSQIQGLTLALVVITILFSVLFGSLKMGLISMIPNVAPILIVGGLMGWVGTYLDYSKLLIAPVAVGIAVDDTIHMMTRIKLEFARWGNYRKAYQEAIQEVGRALVITSVTLICGWSAMLISTMEFTFWFSVLLSCTILLALLADLFIMPILIIWFKPFGPETVKDTEAEMPIPDGARL